MFRQKKNTTVWQGMGLGAGELSIFICCFFCLFQKPPGDFGQGHFGEAGDEPGGFH
jgi:hypothetical protein